MSEVKVFEWSREAPEAFVARLNALWPPYGRTPWLVPFWSPGTPEEPVQRWTIHVARPACTLSENEREEIEARSMEVLPPGVGRESPLAVARALEMAIDPVPYADAPLGRLRALGYWEVHRAIPLPVWVVQGEDGGHPYRRTEAERRMLRLLKMPDDEPEIGTLSYHPLDEHVITRLHAFDRMRKMEELGGVQTKRLEKEQADRQWRAAFLDYMGVTDHETREMADLLARCGVTQKQEGGIGPDESEAKYVETGNF